jgi:hypothetical protein
MPTHRRNAAGSWALLFSGPFHVVIAFPACARRKEDGMSDIHGRLLIGGMTLKDLYGAVELRDDCACGGWCGHLLIDLAQNQHLESGRQYRLELDDGRAGKIVVTRIECPPGERTLRVLFDGVAILESPRVPVLAMSETPG